MIRINNNLDLGDFEFMPGYDNVVRIATIGDGSCFFHGVLNSIYPIYQNLNRIDLRMKMVRNLRRELSVYINEVYETLEAANELAEHDPRYSKEVLSRRLGNSSVSVGDEYCQLVSDLFKIHIYLIKQNGKYIIDIGDQYSKVIIIAHVGNHYENVGFMTNGGIRTIFDRNSESFLNFLDIAFRT